MRLVALVLLLAAPAAQAKGWPHLARFVEVFVEPNGRVVDRTDDNRSTSEGQAYGLFFALVANDRALFDRLLGWTGRHLARGDLARHLPAWKYGQDERKRWRVLDPAAASDADLWIGYVLLEAARLWRVPAYDRLGRALLANVVRREVVAMKGLGPMLLPGPHGFVLEKDKVWRLNPSYVPLQLPRRLAALGVPGPWADLPATMVRMIRDTSPAGFAADWIVWDADGGFAQDRVGGAVGSYDAIRVYLWAALLDGGEPLRAPLLAGLGGPVAAFREGGSVPEKVNVVTAEASGTAPPGFYAVVEALALAAADPAAAEAARRTLDEYLTDGLYVAAGDTPRYYDQVLTLFARGWVEGRFRFSADGALVPAWEQD